MVEHLRPADYARLVARQRAQDATPTAERPPLEPRALRPDLPRLPYREANPDAEGNCHFGQLKLLLSEVAFLVRHAPTDGGAESRRVLYGGAAPGYKNWLLAELFPGLSFDFVDATPDEFSRELRERGLSRRCRVHRCYLSDAWIRERPDLQGCLFISDVRSVVSGGDVRRGGDWGRSEEIDSAANEAQVWEDHEAQLRWAELLKAPACLFKFRLPWDRERAEYLDGEVRLQPFAPRHSSETRLEGRLGSDGRYPRREYDCRAYEEQLSHFNNRERPAARDLGRHEAHLSLLRSLVPGLCRCWDCASFIRIADEYLASPHAAAAGWVAGGRERKQPRSRAEDGATLGRLMKQMVEACQGRDSPYRVPHCAHEDRASAQGEQRGQGRGRRSRGRGGRQGRAGRGRSRGRGGRQGRGRNRRPAPRTPEELATSNEMRMAVQLAKNSEKA
jgi:hypothetical protein